MSSEGEIKGQMIKHLFGTYVVHNWNELSVSRSGKSKTGIKIPKMKIY